MLKKIKTLFKNREQNFNMHRSLLISYLILGVLLCTINTVFFRYASKKVGKGISQFIRIHNLKLFRQF